MSVRLNHTPARAKTTSFTLDPTTTRCGTVFTNAGAGAEVDLTLPQLAPNATWDGYWVEFHGVADFTIKVICTAGKMITKNNAAATSLAASTGGQLIGSAMRARWDADQSKWHVDGIAVGCAYTVA